MRLYRISQQVSVCEWMSWARHYYETPGDFVDQFVEDVERGWMNQDDAAELPYPAGWFQWVLDGDLPHRLVRRVS